jgi:hypothetical protein
MEEMESESTILHLIGDGMGLSPFDERGGPLRTGLSVERIAGRSAAALTAELERASGRKLLRPVEKEEVELGGGARGTVLYTTFKKDGGGKGLYEQLVVADPREGAWLVTFWIVASTDSRLPARGSELEARLAWYLRSFELAPRAGE